MEIWLWFSNFCPFFNVRQAERAISELGPYFSINALSLKSIEAYEAAQWFERHEKSWGEFKTKIPSFYENAAKKNYQLTFWNSLNYPELLKRLYHPPAVLFSRGNFDAFKKPSAAVIGARNPTNLGRLWVQAAIPEVSKAGINIISGGARGIDSEAHWSALSTKNTTVAFLPGGVENPYPKSNKFMFDRILENNGALVSEFPPGMIVRRENFFQRNRLIAGASRVVIVVEAAQKSGTIMTANHAIKDNIDVLIVPGPPMVTSYAGSLDLLKAGSVGIARDHQDVIEAVLKKML